MRLLPQFLRNGGWSVSRDQAILSAVWREFVCPSELMPLEPTLFTACYRVTGRILHRGVQRMHICGIPVRPEEADEKTFFLWIGEMVLPWVQDEPEEEVVSPANQPEFMQRMLNKWLETREEDDYS